MKKIVRCIFIVIVFISSACSLSAPAASPAGIPTITATQAQLAATFTPIPTLTLVPETIVLDFAAQLCNSKWMNGGQKFASCPDANSDHSAGYAILLDPASEGLPDGTPVLLTIPALNGYSALFMRYPALTIRAGDHFRATLRCQTNATNCDVNFGLDYYDANGKYHSPLAMWDYKAGQAPIDVDYDLSSLAGQNVDIVLALRPNNESPEQDLALWISPQIYRLSK